MIFSTNNQLFIFFVFLFWGFIFGIIIEIFSIIFLKKYLKIYQKIIFDSIFYTFFVIFFVILLNFYNFGHLSYVLILSFILGIFWINRLSINLVDFISLKWYNFLKAKYDTRKLLREKVKLEKQIRRKNKLALLKEKRALKIEKRKKRKIIKNASSK